MKAIFESELRWRLSQVKLLALDVDGVLTDGGLYYTEIGEVLQRFNIKDGQGLKLLMQSGIEVAIITAKSYFSTIHRAKALGIAHTYLGVEDKLSTLKSLCDKLGLSLSQVAYVGDDINDLTVMQAVGCPLTVADAMSANQACAVYVTKQAGGQGAVREICDMLITTSLATSKKRISESTKRVCQHQKQ
jgi:3-deoxy-D-manno-octulosonate 8-phosphate phosphatase (KDO 8-P phosphatase)